MAKTKIDKDDIKRLVENTSNPSSTTSVYSAKYVDDNFLKEITKAMVEAKLTGVITSHQHNYTTSLFRGELSDALSPTPASFQSGNLLNGIYDIISEITYYDVPNKSCGTDASKSGMKGSLVSQLNGVGKSLIYHCFNTNNIYICSGTIDEVDGHIIWSTWKRLLTCKDKNEIPDDLEGSIEEEGYLYQINSSYQRISLNSEDIKSKTVKIDLKLFNSQVGAKLRIIIEFNNVSANPDINIIDSTSPAKTINYSASYYTDPYYVANVYRVEYEIFNLSNYWLVSNKIY